MEPGAQFSEIDQPTPPGMTYNRAPQSRMQRKAIVDTEEPLSKHHEYYSPTSRVDRFDPKSKVIPNEHVTDPHTVAFADYHDDSRGDHKEIYLDFVHSRQRGHHHAEHLINSIADDYPEHSINLGKVMNEGVWKVKEDLEARGRQVRGTRNF